MYGPLFCRLYNEFGWNEYPEVFAGQLLRWLEGAGASPRTALDLGCGTGVLCDRLRQAGIRALGVDLSGEMIALARDQFPECRFEAADMVTWRSGERFDLITCTGDALNHLSHMDDVARVFRNVRHMLNPGGLFCFDLLRAEEVPLGEPFEADWGESGTIRFSATMADGRSTLTVEAFSQCRLAFTETICETLHDPAAVRAALAGAGLTLLRFADRLNEADAPSATWYVVARSDG